MFFLNNDNSKVYTRATGLFYPKMQDISPKSVHFDCIDLVPYRIGITFPEREFYASLQPVRKNAHLEV